MNNTSKKISVLFGSPHKNGYTSNLLNYFLSFLPDCEISLINAYEKNVKPCIDCNVCKTVEKCFYNDMDDIDCLLRKCDIIVVASPVYNTSFPAPLKAILDRMQRYYRAKFDLKTVPPIKKEKTAVVLLTQGSSNDFTEENIKTQIEPLMSLLNAHKTEYLTLKNTDDKNLDIDNFYIKSKNKVQNIINNLYNKF
jgi:multimeric flavodoxin WrbA